jgi:hypothetical protein
VSARQRRHSARLRRPWHARAVLATGMLLLLAAACGSATGAPDRTVSSVRVPASLATSIETSTGSWAAIPMGRLDQPLNTFWQLFFRPRGSFRWSDQASALAVATNGGLVLAALGGRSLAVGIRPANLLDFSPLLVTSDAGRSWLPASPISALAKQPNALAVGAGGRALALTSGASGDEVLESFGRLASWRELTTSTDLKSSSAARTCGLVSLTAVGLAAANSVIGADCAREGVVGIFSETQGGWRLAGPALPPALHRGIVDVLALEPTRSGLCALLAVADGDGTSLVAAWTDGQMTWRVSPVLDVGSEQVQSVGSDGDMGLFVLASGSLSETVDVLTGPGAAWNGLPAPPAGTETLVFGAAGRVDALTVDDTAFTDWVLAVASRRWTRAQVIDVPVQFGSSS